MEAARSVSFSPDGSVTCTDGGRETTIRFNETYRGYYPECLFTAALAGENGFYLAGTDPAGAARLFTSGSGGVWSELNLTPREQPRLPYECGSIRTVLETEQAVFVICENGWLLTLPGCPKCVKAVQYPERFEGGELQGENLVLRCESGREQTVLLEALQQVRTSWSYALPFLRSGALLLDLREESDDEPELPFALHESLQCALLRVRRQEPQEPVFFFCYTGLQADTAAEFARRLGHGNAFSLGGKEHLLSRNGGVWPEKENL